jgi:Domain of unknown function (DUF4783)
MKFYLTFSLLLLFFVIVASPSFAQEEVLSTAKVAFKAGNSKDLSRYFHNNLEIKIDDNEADNTNSIYSKTQAEYVLKDFFKDNPPQDFIYVHHGTSKDGMKYAIGKYTCRDSTGKPTISFRVFLKLKQYDGSYLIDEIDFSKENN